MKRYVVALCVPEDSSITKEEIQQKIRETYYLDKNDNSEKIDIISIDYNSLVSEEKDFDLQKKLIGNIDVFMFSPETIVNEKTRKYLTTALNIDNQIVNSENNRSVCTNFFCVYKGEKTELQRQSINLLLNSYKDTWISVSDIEYMKENMIGNSNLVNQVRDVIENTEKNFLNIIDDMFENLKQSGQQYTINHVSSVAAIAEQVAIAMGYEGERLDCVKYAAILHDYGKQFIPSSIINSKNRLTEDEFALMKNHTSIGAAKLNEVLKNNNSKYLDHIINTSLQHHERPDGTGYPLGLKEDEIDPVAKIVSVADAFQAMLGRTYQTPKSLNEIIDELNTCSTPDENGRYQFSKEVADTLVKILKDKNICKKMGIFWKSKDGKVEYKVPTLENLNITEQKPR